MNKEEIEKALIERANIIVQLAEINRGYDAMLRQILTPELQAELDAIEAERKSATVGASEKLAQLEENIKASVVSLGQTVKVDGVSMAVYNKGKVSWDTKGLDGLMVAIPQLATFRKVGEPYTVIRGA